MPMGLSWSEQFQWWLYPALGWLSHVSYKWLCITVWGIIIMMPQNIALWPVLHYCIIDYIVDCCLFGCLLSRGAFGRPSLTDQLPPWLIYAVDCCVMCNLLVREAVGLSPLGQLPAWFDFAIDCCLVLSGG